MKKKIYIIALLLIMLSGCQTYSRQFGGDVDVNLPANEKLIMVSWKDNAIWYLTRPMKTSDIAETYKYTEFSNLRIFKGTVTIREFKND